MVHHMSLSKPLQYMYIYTCSNINIVQLLILLSLFTYFVTLQGIHNNSLVTNFDVSYIYPSISIYLSNHQSMHLFVIHSSLCPFIHPSLHPSILLLIHHSIFHLFFPFISFIHPSILSSIHPFIHPSIHPFIHIYWWIEMDRLYVWMDDCMYGWIDELTLVRWWYHLSIHPSIHIYCWIEMDDWMYGWMS